jgi:competence protein ComEC
MQQRIDSIAFVSSETNALIKALLTGCRTDLPPETTDAFRSSGASHILALSGLHLGIIYLIISKIAGLAGGHPKIKTVRSVICITACSAYSFATGAGASIIRALIFIIIGEISRLLNRKPNLKTTCATSLIIHLTLSPGDISRVGFQLSYAAIAGIAWIFPWLKSIWPDDGDGIMKRIWESAALSISCQITTGPLAWIYFGTFPQYFILTNLIALPMTSLIIPAALLTLVLDSMKICPHILIRATEALANALCGALGTIAAI